MVIHKGDEQHVGEGKKHRCEHIAVYSLQLHYLSEDPSEEEGGVGDVYKRQVLTFVFGRFYPINDVGNYSQAYNWDTKANSFVANTVGQIAQPVLALSLIHILHSKK